MVSVTIVRIDFEPSMLVAVRTVRFGKETWSDLSVGTVGNSVFSEACM